MNDLKQQLIKLLEKEIEWCDKHPFEKPPVNDYMTGFINGLKQAIILVKKYKQIT